MSAKWRALQRRHRWTYDTVVLPDSYTQTLLSLPSSYYSNFRFFEELKHVASLGSIHAQLTSFKKVVSAFSELLSKSQASEDVNRLAMALYLEILFQENSLALHRSILSAFCHNFAVHHQPLVKECFESLCKDYGSGGCKYRRFAMAAVVTSILSLPKAGFLKEVVENCAAVMAQSLSSGLRSVIKEADDGARPSPNLMEKCQEAVSSLYYLLQQFPHKFMHNDMIQDRAEITTSCCEDPGIIALVLSTILEVLKSTIFSRDCVVAAGVCLAAAIQTCVADPDLALLLSTVLFSKQNTRFSISASDRCFEDSIQGETASQRAMKMLGCDLAAKFHHFTDFGKLCVFRGMLTATPRAVLNQLLLFNCHDSSEDTTGWTLLFDGILPAVCGMCENPIDSHFNFHSVTALQICLQQVKASFIADLPAVAAKEFCQLAHTLGFAAKTYNPFSHGMLNRVLKIIWNNWEDPLNQTVKQVQVLFELLIDQYSYIPKPIENGGAAKKIDGNREFLSRITSELLSVGGHRKGRYVPLAILGERLGARNLLSMSPNLLFETVEAYVDDDICCAAASFLKSFLEHLREDCFSHAGGIEKGYQLFRRLWIPPILSGLVADSSKLRSNLNTYAVPVALQIDSDGIFIMFAFILNTVAGKIKSKSEVFNFIDIEGAVGLPQTLTLEQKVAATISLLKVARSLALVEGNVDWCLDVPVLPNVTAEIAHAVKDQVLVNLKGHELNIPYDWLKFSLTHMDESIRVDAAEFLFLNPKTSSLVSTLELSLMQMAIPLNMRCSSTAFRMKWTSLFKKFFLRVQTTMERHLKQATSTLSRNACNIGFKDKSILGILRAAGHNNALNVFEPGTKELDQFMKWLSRILIFSLYPSAPYERKYMAMELFLVMIDIWPFNNKGQGSHGSGNYFPCEWTLLADFTFVILGAIVDSWDRLRENAFQILLQFPTPLPGINRTSGVNEVISWAKALVSSPRVRECDAGALTLRLIFRKYVQGLGWSVRIAENQVIENGFSKTDFHENCLNVRDVQIPVGDYIESLIDWLEVGVQEGEKDLVKACERSFIHGILLTLRYTVEELDWTSDAAMKSSFKLHLALERLLALVVRVTSLALWVVSVDALTLPENIENLCEDFNPCASSSSFDNVEPKSVDQSLEKESNDFENAGPVDQVVMVGCWLAMKELSLLLGTITRKVPLPAYDRGSLSVSCHENLAGNFGDGKKQMGSSDCILDIQQLEIIGQHFLQVLLAMKHNGAIDKTRAGFTALCNRLLCSNDPRLNKMPETWMKQLMQRTIAKGQTVDDLLRRSAGIPAAFIALFLAEPEGTPKKLLPSAMRWLIDVANSFLSKSDSTGEILISDYDALSVDNGYKKLSLAHVHFPSLPPNCADDGSGKLSYKQRDEGVVPTVHAFNVLKVAFHDTNLSTDTSGFCSEALITAIKAFSSHHWEVRNSATLAYTALVHRMIGFLNVHKRQSARRAMTGFEFFHRYPALHPFLLEELCRATEQLEESSSPLHRNTKIGQSLHPSLCPVLIILSRFKPSGISRGTEEWLNPSAFIPFVQRCATQRNLKVRILASKALAPLVSAEDLQNALVEIAGGLPSSHWRLLDYNFENNFERNVIDDYHDVQPEKGTISFNAVHGMLLQLDSLIVTNCMNLRDDSEKDEIINALVPLLQGCSWLGYVKFCSCPIVSGAYLKVLVDLLRLARTYSCKHAGFFMDMLLYLSSQCLNAPVGHWSNFFDSTVIEMQVQAAEFYFNAFLGGGSLANSCPEFFGSCNQKETLKCVLDKLKACLSHPAYELRSVALKMLKQILLSLKSKNYERQLESNVDVLCEWLKLNLQTLVLESLEVERHPKCLCKLLQVFFLYSSDTFLNCGDDLNATWDAFDRVTSIWRKLVSLKSNARHGKIEELLMSCLGVSIRHLIKIIKFKILSDPSEQASSSNCDSVGIKSEKWEAAYGCICTWIALIMKHSDPSEVVNMRRATAEGIVASGLIDDTTWISEKLFLQRDSGNIENCEDLSTKRIDGSYGRLLNFYGCAVLDTWFTAIKLLEDEDASLRQKLSVTLFHLMSSPTQSNSEFVPSQVERVLELCFEFLTSNFSHWLIYFDYLANRVFGSEDSHVFTAKNGDLVRRLFDKELDNHHEERLLVCQLCCFHLQNNLRAERQNFNCEDNNACSIDGHGVSGRVDRIKSFINLWRIKFLCKTISFLESCNRMDGKFSWLGGIANHQDVFRIIYICLLGLYSFSSYPIQYNDSAALNQLSSKLTDLKTLINPFLSNPFIYNLYVLLLQVFEKQMGSNLGFMETLTLKDCHLLQDFNPYFLIQ